VGAACCAPWVCSAASAAMFPGRHHSAAMPCFRNASLHCAQETQHSHYLPGAAHSSEPELVARVLHIQALEQDYYFNMFYDDLPIWGFIGKLEKVPKPGGTDLRYFLFTHGAAPHMPKSYSAAW